MYSRAQLKKYSESVATIKSITRVYEEAAARRVKLIQNAVDKLAEFIDACADTYLNIKFGILAAKNTREHLQITDLNLQSRRAILTTSYRSRPKKGLLIFISSHQDYYGNLIPSVFRNWKHDLEITGYDGIILGNTGGRLLSLENVKNNVQVFDLDDDHPDWTLVNKIADIAADYNDIYVYFGQYRTVLTQAASQSKISATVSFGQVQEVKRYLFEGAPEGTLAFFEKQIISALLEEKVYQSQKARYAARIKILEIGQVAEKMSQQLGELDRGRRNVARMLNNKKQQQLYGGLALWQEGKNG